MGEVIRKLASIQKVEKVEPIPGADFIEKATVLGWECIIKKGELQPGNFAVYFEIDSLLPDIEAFSFLKDPKGKVPKVGFVHRLKTKKLRGIVSQGLLMPMTYFPSLPKRWYLGQDVTKDIGVEKYDPEVPQSTLRTGKIAKTFPSFIPKTDEWNLQANVRILDDIKGRMIYITTKMDGTSATYYLHKDHFGVCSRTMEWKIPIPEPSWRTRLRKLIPCCVLKKINKHGYLRAWQRNSPNTYWDIANELKMEEKLRSLHMDLAIQGEIVGPGIQKNPGGFKQLKLYVFNIWDITHQKNLNLHDTSSICYRLGLHMVPLERITKAEFPLTWYLEQAKGKYEGTDTNKEGIVVRTVDNPKVSFKVKNKEFLLKEEE